MVERRRCHRLPLTIPVKVSAGSWEPSLPTATATMTISKYGGFADMKPRVKLGQKILIVNRFTQEKRECSVVYVEPKQHGRRKVAVELSSAGGDCRTSIALGATRTCDAVGCLADSASRGKDVIQETRRFHDFAPRRCGMKRDETL